MKPKMMLSQALIMALSLGPIVTHAEQVLPVSVNKSVASTVVEVDSVSMERSRYIIRLNEPSVAQYGGGIESFAPTNPTLTQTNTSNKSGKLNKTQRDVVAYQGYLKRQQQTVINKIANIASASQIKHQMQFALNGLVVELTADEVEQISQLDNIKSIEKDQLLHLNTDTSADLTGASSVWIGDTDDGTSALGNGTVVAIFDTGVNTDHPSFAATGDDGYTHTNPLGSGNYLGDCETAYPSLCNDKLIGVYSYTLITNQYSDSDIFPAGLARNGEDYNGHGSHVASTAAGNILYDVPTVGLAYDVEVSDGYPGEFTFDRISGIAPHANIISFQVCLPGETDDEYNGCYSSLAVTAIDEAIELGIVDAINYSISGGESVWGDSLSEAWLSANNAGIFVAHSAGNDGPAAETSDKYAPWITPVAASDHGRSIDYSKTISGFSGGNSTPSTISGVSNTAGITANVVYAGDYSNSNDPTGDPAQCLEPFPAGTFDGEIVLCERGDIARIQKAINVAAGGAGGYILANVSDGATNLVGDEYVIPGIHVNASAGTSLKSWLASGSNHRATISTTAGTLTHDDEATDNVASFSSRGPNTEISTLLPMLAAPGVDIYAAYADEHYGHETTGAAPADYAFLDGTSMASPQVAGAALLLREAHPDWSADAIRSALMMTANTDMGVEDSSESANWFDMGSGRIQIDAAIDAGLIVEETQENYLAADPTIDGDPKQLNIPALVNSNCLIQCEWQRTVTATKAGSWNVSLDDLDSNLELSASPSSFTLAAGESQTITFTITSWNAKDGEWVFANALLTSDGAQELHMPVAVLPSNGNFPDDISQTSFRNADSFLISDIVAIEITDFSYTSSGLVPASLITDSLAEDSEPDEFLDDITDGVYYEEIIVADNTDRLVAEVVSSTAPDLDLYLAFDANDDGAVSTSEIIASSTSYSWEEYINVQQPDSGTYYLFIHNYTGSTSSQDSFSIEYAVVNADNATGTLSVNAPSSAALREEFDMRVIWSIEDSLPGDRFYGNITLGSDSDTPDNLGVIPVDITRGENDVSVEAESVSRLGPGESAGYTITIQQNETNESRDYVITATVPEQTSIVESSVTAGGVVSGNTVQWEVTQEPTITPLEYTVTTPESSAQCTIPEVGQSSGYIDLSEMGYAATRGITAELSAAYPVDFALNGQTFSGITVSSKGFILPAKAQLLSYPGLNRSLASDQFQSAILAPLWSDWSFANTDDAGITVASFNDDSVTVIEWSGMQSGSVSADFEVILVNDDKTGLTEIIYAYKEVSYTSAELAATVGLHSGITGSGKNILYQSATATNDSIAATQSILNSGAVYCLNTVDSTSAVSATSLSFDMQLDSDATVTGALAVTVSSSVPNIPGTEEEVAAVNTEIQVHSAPVILIDGSTNATLTLTEQKASVLPITVTDENGDDVTLTVNQTSGPTAAVSIVGESVTVTPAALANGDTLTLTITATDEYGYSNSATVTINVEANQPPVLTVTAPSSVREGSTITVRASATDPEGDTVTFTINGVVGASYSMTAPATDDTTTVTFSVVATDGVNSVTETVSVTVTAKPKGGGTLSWLWLSALLMLVSLRRIRPS